MLCQPLAVIFGLLNLAFGSRTFWRNLVIKFLEMACYFKILYKLLSIQFNSILFVKDKFL